MVVRQTATPRQNKSCVPFGTRRKNKNKLPRVRNTTPSPDISELTKRRRSVLHPEWAIVLGGSEDVWNEVLAWEKIYGKQWDGVVVATNDVGSHWPRELDFWCTLHPERMAPWRAVRKAHGFSEGYITAGRRRNALDIMVHPWAGGSSGMLAVQVAQYAGCTRVVLCGVPMTPTPHFVESAMHRQKQRWMACAGHWKAWTQQHKRMDGWVRSMSGRTASLLGLPTIEWLQATA